MDEELHDAPSTVHRLRALTVELDLLGSEFGRTNGLHPTDVRALICLLDARRHSTAATPGWLGQQLGLESASVTALIDRMERAGHVGRTRDAHDRRKVLLNVTPSAIALGQAFFGPLIDRASAELAQFSDSEQKLIDRFLARMQAAVTIARNHEQP
nr:MarR family transcriptional regulator [uncultured Rhodococcus sp.]